MTQVIAVQLFDANVQIGRHRQLQPGMPFSTADLLRDMNRFGIAEALVLDSLSREAHLGPGNRRVLTEVEGQPRLHPCWALIPPGTGEIGPLETLLDRMHQAGVRAAKLFPGHYTFSLQEWCVGELLSVLEEGRVPTFIDANTSFVGMPMDVTDWDAVVALCTAHPKLPVIISEGRFRSANRMIYQALAKCPNLHLELSGFWAHRGIEYVCREFGPERLLFGSKWPVREIGGPVAQLAFAEISERERALIGGDNLRALLAGAFPHRATPRERYRVEVKRPSGDTLRARALRSEPPAGLIIDAHAHLGRSCIYHLAGSSPAQVAREMERLGVRCSLVFGFSGVTGDWTYDNDLVARAMERHPGRYHGLIVVNPTRPDEMMAELNRCEGRGFVGVKLIPHYQGYPNEGPNIELAVRWAAERGLICLNHYWGAPEHLRRLAICYPQVTFIIGHYTTQYRELVNGLPHVFQCTCEPLSYDSMEALTRELDPAKIVFGSDVTDLPLAMGMGPILHARIAEEHKWMILGGNARRILERVGVVV